MQVAEQHVERLVADGRPEVRRHGLLELAQQPRAVLVVHEAVVEDAQHLVCPQPRGAVRGRAAGTAGLSVRRAVLPCHAGGMTHKRVHG
jgi:hypothetical protein